jgi:uncharacterized protein YoxC
LDRGVFVVSKLGLSGTFYLSKKTGGISMLLEISAIMIALAFVALVIYLIQTLKSLNATLVVTQQTVNQLTQKVTQISAEVTDVIHSTNLVTLDVRRKMITLDFLFNSVSDIGQIVNVFTSTAKKLITLKGGNKHEIG